MGKPSCCPLGSRIRGRSGGRQEYPHQRSESHRISVVTSQDRSIRDPCDFSRVTITMYREILSASGDYWSLRQISFTPINNSLLLPHLARSCSWSCCDEAEPPFHLTPQSVASPHNSVHRSQSIAIPSRLLPCLPRNASSRPRSTRQQTEMLHSPNEGHLLGSHPQQLSTRT
jgi:hypothetical protein